MNHDSEVADFVSARSAALLRYATLLTGDPATAEDLLQDALVRAYEGWARIDNPDAYIRRAMYTLSVSRWRKITRRERTTDTLPETPAPGPEDGQAEHDAVISALAHLPMRARTALVLRYYEDRDDAQIAEILGITPGAVRTTLTRARQQLRAQLTPQEVTR